MFCNPKKVLICTLSSLKKENKRKISNIRETDFFHLPQGGSMKGFVSRSVCRSVSRSVGWSVHRSVRQMVGAKLFSE